MDLDSVLIYKHAQKTWPVSNHLDLMAIYVSQGLGATEFTNLIG